ncbi:hypothetical protein AWV80_26160 [Cupriavidus sp. UYMU48A]|nr:hypothetical protein AWV80_26160 [Cupriavidus sp. UYMU48A]
MAPSNPYLSVKPMLDIPGMREALTESRATKVAVSPLIGGLAVKGPLVKLMEDLNIEAGNSGIASVYEGIIDSFIIDQDDVADAEALRHRFGFNVEVISTLINTPERAETLARHIISLS